MESKYGGWRGLVEADRVGPESIWWRDLKNALLHSHQGQVIQNGLKWNVREIVIYKRWCEVYTYVGLRRSEINVVHIHFQE